MGAFERLLGHRLTRFVIVGGGAAALLAGLTYLFLRLGAPPFLGGLVAYAVAFAVAYVLQRNWTFRRSGSHRHTLPKYFAGQVLCAAVSGAVTHLLVQVWGQDPGPSAVVATVIVSALSFVLSSTWVFRDQTEPR